MRRNTSTQLTFLMHNQRANSPMEARVWTKIAKLAFNLKIKMTKRVSTVLLLKKLQKRKSGTNDVEYFCKTIIHCFMPHLSHKAWFNWFIVNPICGRVENIR